MNTRQFLEAKRMWDDGVSSRAICELLDLNESTFCSYRQFYKKDFPSRWNHSTRAERQMARDMRASGARVKDIANQFGVSRETVRRWMHEE